MQKDIDKLVMVNVKGLKIPYGTLLSVTKEHRSKAHWVTREAESDKPYIVNKADVKEI